MFKKFSIIWATILACCISQDTFGNFSGTGATFLLFYPGARQVGMGGAFCGLADDGMATYYNPAGLAFQKAIDIPLNFSLWSKGLYPDVYQGYGGVAIPLGTRLTLAPAVTYLTTGEREGTDPYGTRIARWRTWDLAAGLYCGVPISDGLGVGGGIKFVYSYLAPGWLVTQLFHTRGGGQGSTFAVDIGVFARHSLSNHMGRIGMGIALQNLGPSIQYIEGGASDPLPMAIRMGVSYKLILRDETRICLVADLLGPLVNLSSLEDVLIDSWQSIGVELAPLAFLALRFGYFHDKAGHRKGLTWGVGLDSKFLRLDLANDSRIYEFETSNWRLQLAINVGTPILLP